jgi:hypothetical protein
MAFNLGTDVEINQSLSNSTTPFVTTKSVSPITLDYTGLTKISTKRSF